MHTMIIGGAAYLFTLIVWASHCARVAYVNAKLMPVIPSSFYQMDATPAQRGPVDPFEYETTRG